MKIFQELGEQIEQRWRNENYQEEELPDVASDALDRANLHERVTAWDILRWVFTQSFLPDQRDLNANFSNAPITLFTGQRFYIDAYYWLDGTTDIHQHGFSGAFQVLRGSSLHSSYRFEPHQIVNNHFAIGNIVLEKVELLEEKAIRPIHAGNKFIHSLFHLDRPSVTITVRTNNTPKAFPQYSYLKPYIALNPFFKEQAALKKLQGLSILLGMQHNETDSFVSELLAYADLQTTFAALGHLYSALGQNQIEKRFGISTGDERFLKYLESAREKHGAAVVDQFLSVYEYQSRQTEIVNKRRLITEPEHRFFLALLLNIDERVNLLELVQKRFPEDEPVEKVLDWMTELGATRVYGSDNQNVLNLADFDDDCLAVFECLLKGADDSEVKATLALEYSSEYADSLEERIPEICRALRSARIIKPLLQN